jgi:Domain of unknown function (DUF932)
MKYESLDSLIERVVQEHGRKEDMLADTRRMSVAVEVDEEDGNAVNLTVDDENGLTTIAPSGHMLGQMATDLGIPKRYFDRMKVDAPDLFRSNVHHWLYKEPKRRMLRTYKVDDSTFNGRAWLSDRYRRLDNIEIATRLLPEFERLPEAVEFHNASITDERFYLRATFPRMTQDVKVGDAVTWGVQIRNSEVGGATFAIESFLLQLICKNGMVVAKALNARHIGKRLDDVLSDEAVEADDHAFWLAARDTLRASMDEAAFEQVVNTLRETTNGTKIQNVPKATERLAKTLSLSEEEKDVVLTNIAAGGDLTRWGAISAITNAAQTVESFDRGVELEELGWNLAELPQRDWERIAVAV